MTLTVGQELWFTPADHRHQSQGYSVRVKKVGRKWAELDNYGRINIESLWMDGGQYSSPGRCWLSKRDWEEDVERRAYWIDLFRRLCYTPPEGVSIEAMRTINRILGFRE